MDNTPEFRLIVDKEPRDAFTNMALDEAVLKSSNAPTVRFYQWKPAAVSIGRFQSLHEEVDTEVCNQNCINVVRRITGGGAVFHDKELTYSIVIPIKNDYFPAEIMRSYDFICSAIIKGLSYLGLDVKYVPLNDLVLDGKKISGCAQTRSNSRILQHGTLLIEVDVEKMFSLLKVPDEKIRDKMIATVKERVTSINNVLEKKAIFEDLIPHLKRGFEETFGVKLVEGDLTEEEIKAAERIRAERFAKKEWNEQR